MKQIIFNFVFILLCAVICWAEDSGRRFDNITGMKVAIGARAQALGGAFTARALDGTATYWNPALIESFGPYDAQLTAMALPLALERRAAFLSYIQSLGQMYGSVGASWYHYRIGLIEARDAAGIQLGASEDLQNALAVSYGLALDRDWKVGASLKYYHHQLSGEYGQSAGLDLAAAYHPKQQWLFWEFGLVLKDISPGLFWSTGRKENVFPTLRLGVAYHFIYEQLIAAVDWEVPLKQKVVPHVGFEWWLWETIAVRTGLDSQGVHFGAGYAFGPYQFDYAYSVLLEGLSEEHRITLGYKI